MAGGEIVVSAERVSAYRERIAAREAEFPRCSAIAKTMNSGRGHPCKRRAVKDGVCRVHHPDWEFRHLGNEEAGHDW